MTIIYPCNLSGGGKKKNQMCIEQQRMKQDALKAWRGCCGVPARSSEGRGAIPPAIGCDSSQLSSSLRLALY